MTKLMMGTSEVLKVMMGTEEVTSLFMGSEEISQSTISPDSWLIIEWGGIPNDGDSHSCVVFDEDWNIVSELYADPSNGNVYTNDYYPDTIATDSYDDQGDISQGWVRWFLKGSFNGEYHIQIDGTDVNVGEPIEYDGTEKVNYVDVQNETMTTYTCYAEWDCVVNGCPNCYWDGTECVENI